MEGSPNNQVVPSGAAPFPFWVRRGLAEKDDVLVREVVRHDIYRTREMPVPETVLDVGANIGAFSALVRHRWPHAEVAAVEPDLENFRVLIENTREGHITPFLGAVTYGPERRTVHSVIGAAALNQGMSYVDRPGWKREVLHDGGVPHIERPCLCITLADVVLAMGWDEIDVLKLDCEGGEFEILRSEDLPLARLVVGEWHGRERFREAWHSGAHQRFDLEVLHDDEIGIFRATRRM